MNASLKDAEIVDQQVAYYRARAAEYDEWFLRQGRYDRGPEHRAEWLAECAEIERALRATVAGTDVLELACGTGLWTRHLADVNRAVLAVDASPEALAINRARVRAPHVVHVEADIFSWTPPTAFGAVVFAFWLSHVPMSRFAAFWDMVRRSLRPGGVVFLADSLPQQESTARDHDPLDTSGRVRRRLNDGREFEIVKIFHEPRQLEERLRQCGWRGRMQSTGKYFFYGAFRRDEAA